MKVLAARWVGYPAAVLVVLCVVSLVKFGTVPTEVSDQATTILGQRG